MLQPNATTTSTITFAGDEYKYAVADILTSFASGEPSNPTTVNSIFSTATSTTDLLTPTTLASLEQSLADIQEGSSSKVAHESGFIPPVVNTAPSTTAQMVKQEYSDFIYDDDSSLEQDSQWFGPGGKRSRYESNAIVIQPFSPASSSTTSTTTNRRRRLRDENLTPEEMERRNIRRERNKIAAAKCRQRRVDLTNKLIVESEGLEEEQSKLENEIQMLQQQKEQLEFLLEAHKPVCSAKVSIKQQSAVKSEKSDVTYTSIISASPSISASSTYQASAASSGNTSTARPNTLPIPTRPQNQALCSVTEATGVSITTPSSVFNFGLESMIDGHTGLTPITGTPSCASQIQRNSTDGSSSSENLSSPTTLMAL